LEALIDLEAGLSWFSLLSTGWALIEVILLDIVVIHLVWLIVVHISSLLVAHIVGHVIIIVVVEVIVHWCWHWGSWLVASKVLGVRSVHWVGWAHWVGSLQEVLIVNFGVVVFLVVDLFEDCKSWLLWGTAAIWGLKVGPKAVSSTEAVTVNLLVSQLGESSSFL
jgi:hypothetical protein